MLYDGDDHRSGLISSLRSKSRVKYACTPLAFWGSLASRDGLRTTQFVLTLKRACSSTFPAFFCGACERSLFRASSRVTPNHRRTCRYPTLSSCVRVLGTVGEYQEVLAPTLECNGVRNGAGAARSNAERPAKVAIFSFQAVGLSSSNGPPTSSLTNDSLGASLTRVASRALWRLCARV